MMETKTSNKTVGLVDIYLKGYPHKKNFIKNINTVPYPFIKHKDVSTHEYATDYILFRNIIYGYLDYIMEDIKEGNLWKLNFGLGEIRLKKIKHKFLVDISKMAGVENPDTQYKRIQTPDDYFLVARWHRRTMNVKLKYNWIIHLSRKVLRDCYDRVNKNHNHIYKYIDA